MEGGAKERMEKKGRLSASFRIPDAMNLTPHGIADASSSCGITSVQIVGGRSFATEEGSPADVMMFPRGAIKFAVASSSTVKDCPKRSASVWAVRIYFAQGWDSMYATGFKLQKH